MYRLLVADDEIIERKVLLKTLQKNLEGQCELFQAENGREALEIYEKEKIQIAILDIEMPGINGIQAAEKIREKDKVEIDYIQKKNIRKVAGSAPGFVIYHTNYSLVASPKCDLQEVK